MSKSKLTKDAMFRQDQVGGAEVRWHGGGSWQSEESALGPGHSLTRFDVVMKH